jgi:cell division protein FtsB
MESGTVDFQRLLRIYQVRAFLFRLGGNSIQIVYFWINYLTVSFQIFNVLKLEKMRKTILILGVLAIFGTVTLAQTKNDTIQQLQRQIENLENRNSRLSKQVNTAKSNIKKLEGRISSTVDSLNVLKAELVLTNSNLQAMANKLESQIQQLSNKTNSDVSALNERVSHNTTLYWILAIIAILLVPAILFGLLRRRLTLVKTELSDQMKTSTEAIREEIIKLDNQVFWSLDFQKGLSKKEQNESEEIDHSLALKVADEIIRIRKNISNMDPETKGLKQLEFAVDRIQDNFKENGYEMVDLLNKPYNPAMKLSAKFKRDESLKHGEQIITRIIKPQINYNNVIIQEAQVEVSIGE